MENKFLHSPELPDSPSWITPETPPPHVFLSDDECACFSDYEANQSQKEACCDNPSKEADVVAIDLTRPPPPAKKQITDFFKPIDQQSSKKTMPYFLQRYNSSSISNSKHAVRPSRSDSESSGPGPSKPKTVQSHKIASKRSAVNKTYSLAKKMAVLLEYVAKYSESEAACHFEIPRTTLRGWKGLDKQPIERAGSSTKKKGKNKTGAGRPISYGDDLDEELNQWILEMRDLNLPVSNKQIQRKAIEVIQPSHPTF